MSVSSSLDIPTGSCAFCQYLAGTRPYTILRRDELTATLVTREQRGVAHVLVIPVQHRKTILDLTDYEAVAIMHAVREAAWTIDHVEGRPGLAIWQNNGVPASQSIPHVHFHVAGTLPGEGTDWGEVGQLSLDETEAIAARLRLVGGEAGGP